MFFSRGVRVDFRVSRRQMFKHLQQVFFVDMRSLHQTEDSGGAFDIQNLEFSFYPFCKKVEDNSVADSIKEGAFPQLPAEPKEISAPTQMLDSPFLGMIE